MILNINISPDEIWEVSLKDATGHEQSGTRPAIVLAVHKSTKLCTVVPLTSQQTASRFSYTYTIRKSKSNGLSVDSIAMIFQIRSLSFERFIRKIGCIEEVHHTKIKILMKEFLRLSPNLASILN